LFRFLATPLFRRIGEIPPAFSLQPRCHHLEKVEVGLGLVLLHETVIDNRAEAFKLGNR
jgi:hypothetical protein